VRVVARCIHGLEWVCAAEVERAVPGASEITLARREVWFTVASLDALLLGLRTADDAFAEMGRATLTGRVTARATAETVLAFPWTTRVAELARIRDRPQNPGIDVVASIEGHKTLTRFAVENAVGPGLAGALDGHYLERTPAGRAPGTASITARIFVRAGDVARGSEIVATIRLGAAPLHRRAYKQDTGPGTLHPPLAAALAQLAAPKPTQHVLDPFCGDGTIAIETALAFPDAHVAGSDLDKIRLANAERNAIRAGVPVSWRRADATDTRADPRADHRVDAIITNPPWDLTVRTTGRLNAFWNQLPQLLADGGRIAAIADVGLDIPSTLEKRGFELTLGTQIRLAGRMSHLILAGTLAGPLSDALSTWRQRALAAKIITPTGF
jgi:23S rRNA G2445 N2-methylase RlmL